MSDYLPKETPPVLSIVVPCHNEEDNLLSLYSRLRAVLDEQLSPSF
jgi:glycosyltransferase involved in cell wall biosynthesis